MRSEDGFIAASVRSDRCVQIAENDNDAMSRKGCNEVCADVVELVVLGADVAVGGCIAGNRLQTAMVVLDGGGEQAVGYWAPRDYGAGRRWVKCKSNALRSLICCHCDRSTTWLSWRRYWCQSRCTHLVKDDLQLSRFVG